MEKKPSQMTQEEIWSHKWPARPSNCLVTHYIGTFSEGDIAKQAEDKIVKVAQSDNGFPELKYTNYRPTKSGRIEVYISNQETEFTREA